uniref:Uncharacterized protein n=1 Tax=Anguilla anguilla TaxID=7936 RepID=A0A0E9UPS9_ANGAN
MLKMAFCSQKLSSWRGCPSRGEVSKGILQKLTSIV